MTPEDLARTHAGAFTETRPWSVKEFAALLDDPSVVLVGDERSFLLGRIVLDEAEVLTLATRPGNRREGLARQRLSDFIGIARDRGVATLFLEVAETNLAALRLYDSEGFEKVGRRPNYYALADGGRVAGLTLRHEIADVATL